MSAPVMSSGEFSRTVGLLPADDAERAREIRSSVRRHRGCAYCRIAGRSLELALQAAVHDQPEWARTFLGEAEHYAGGHPATRGGTAPPGGYARVCGRIERWTGVRPVVAATDASWKKGHAGFGYITTAGHWGLRGWRSDGTDPTGRSKVLVNELRAVELLLAALDDQPDPVLLVDSLPALGFLRQWQRGRTEIMPGGYDLRPRRRNGAPTLVRLAERMAARPGIRLEHVKSHSGHLLNEAADALASIARRRMSQPFDAAARATDLAASFLLSWHQAASAA